MSRTDDSISRQAAIKLAIDLDYESRGILKESKCREIENRYNMIQSAQPVQEKYEYHYDHTDCIWYRPEARNRCPATCAQYRDGWNDAMNYIFRDGKGYRPYRRDQKYEG